MKTEMKLGLGGVAALAAIIVAALFLVPKQDVQQGTTPVASNTPRSTNSDSTSFSNPIVSDTTAGPATQASVFTPADLTSPSTQPSGSSVLISGPSTQPNTISTPSTQPSIASTPANPSAPSGPTNWDALLAGASSTPTVPGSSSASATPGSSSQTPGLLPPTAGPRTTTPPGSNLVPPPPRPTPGTSSGTGTGSTAAAGGTYTVKKGDTLSSISASVYGTPNLWSKIAQANPQVNPNRLKTGAVLTIPAATGAASSSSASTPAAATPSGVPNDNVGGSSLVRDPKTEYQVQSGDSLHKIAQRLYGNANRWEEIYNLNKATIGNSPTKLKIGQILKLPAPPTRLATQP